MQMPNRPDFFGEQIAMDEDDEPIYTEPWLLLQPIDASIDEVVEQCREMGGVPVPSHINRSSNSLMSNLGFVPPNLNFTSLEVYARLPVAGVNLDDYHVIYNSDAHNLMDISEREHFITAYGRSAEGILKYLAEGK